MILHKFVESLKLVLSADQQRGTAMAQNENFSELLTTGKRMHLPKIPEYGGNFSKRIRGKPFLRSISAANDFSIYYSVHFEL